MDSHDPVRKIKIGTSLSPETHEAIVACLRRNRDVFAWSHSDMKGIDPELMCHYLNIDPLPNDRKGDRSTPREPRRLKTKSIS